MLTDNDLKSYINGYLQDRKMSYTRLDKHDRAIGVLLEENERLHSIIKGAREYIHYRLDNGQDMYITQMAELLEILKSSDKVEEK